MIPCIWYNQQLFIVELWWRQIDVVCFSLSLCVCVLLHVWKQIQHESLSSRKLGALEISRVYWIYSQHNWELKTPHTLEASCPEIIPYASHRVYMVSNIDQLLCCAPGFHLWTTPTAVGVAHIDNELSVSCVVPPLQDLLNQWCIPREVVHRWTALLSNVLHQIIHKIPFIDDSVYLSNGNMIRSLHVYFYYYYYYTHLIIDIWLSIYVG